MNNWGENDGFDHFGMIVFIHCHEVVYNRDNTARLKIIGLLTHSNKKHASNSSSDGERAVSARDDSIG